MRQVENVIRLGFDKNNPIHNTTVTLTSGEDKGKVVPRLKVSVNVPETVDELFESIGGQDKFPKFMETVCVDYAHAHIRGEAGKLDDKTTTNEQAVEKLVRASNEFTLATILQVAERSSATKVKAAKVDSIAELMALGLEPAEFQRRVAELLKAA